jgi:membrane glycosyltransferase
MCPRRAAFLLLCILLAAVVLAGATRVLATDGFSGLDGVLLLALAGISPWAALAFGNAWLGLSILLFTRHPAAHVVPALRPAPEGPPLGRTAIAVCLRNEDMAGVIPALERLLDGLPAAHFDLWLLSDTATRHHRQAETTAISGLRDRRPLDAGRIHLRRRQKNTGFKAGNVMEFLENEGRAYDYMLCLDADSEMSPAAVLSLVATMDAAPRIAILQRLIVGRPVVAAFPRLFQFGMRAGMRAWATGQGWWQADQGP